jgi:hypothetical protein
LRGDKGENVKLKCVVEIENGAEPFRIIELIKIVWKKIGGIEPLNMCVEIGGNDPDRNWKNVCVKLCIVSAESNRKLSWNRRERPVPVLKKNCVIAF